MVWYPSPDDVIKANVVAVRKDKHKHRLRRSGHSIQATIDSVKKSESLGLTYQAARLMKELTALHAFDGGNHRTAYLIANVFLVKNGIEVKVVSAKISYAFAREIARRRIKEVQEWIEKYLAT